MLLVLKLILELLFQKRQVVVFGSGPAGLAVMQVARARGARSFDY